MTRAILIVLDSVGIGGAPDAARYGDAGANTIGHIAAACAAGQADRTGLRSARLALPNLVRLGLGQIVLDASGLEAPGLGTAAGSGLFGHAIEISNGKDTPSGHWELAGVPVSFNWGYFPKTIPAFPAELTGTLLREAALPGLLGNCHASGTAILDAFGEAHITSGQPIAYTSTDSVLQIAAHETHFGLERLYEVCEIARRLVDPLMIGRVIARPFVGETSGSFMRTGNRRDYAVSPPEPTLLDRVVARGGQTLTVGKIADIFAHRGVSRIYKASGNDALFDATLAAIGDARSGDLVFANFVDFDTIYGHRRDIAGYAAALEAFDRRLPEIESCLAPGDLAIITADHGCDPTATGTDHTREQVPVLGFGPGVGARDIGERASLADVGATLAAHLGLPAARHGRSFL